MNWVSPVPLLPQYANYSMSSLSWGEQFRQGGIFEDNPSLSPLAGVSDRPAHRAGRARSSPDSRLVNAGADRDSDFPAAVSAPQANRAFVTYCSSDSW